jgi:hypothetical protein
MVALRAGIGDVSAAHLLYFFAKRGVGQDCQTQILPILAFATGDHIVNGRKAQFLMIQMPVDHGFSRLSSKSATISTRPNGGVNLKFAPYEIDDRMEAEIMTEDKHELSANISAARCSKTRVRRCSVVGSLARYCSFSCRSGVHDLASCPPTIGHKDNH